MDYLLIQELVFPRNSKKEESEHQQNVSGKPSGLLQLK